VVGWVRTLPVGAIVLDGEAIGVDDEARPHAFQYTMSSFGRGPDTDAGADGALEAFFFDVLHIDGDDVIDRSLGERLEIVQSLVGERRVPGAITASPEAAAAVLEGALAAGHEGVMVKALDSTYDAGRRGRAWRKVKRSTRSTSSCSLRNGATAAVAAGCRTFTSVPGATKPRT
jgi:ATP-dependent DNA ligase